MDGLTEGRMIHYVLPDGPSASEHRPAVVVKVWNKDTGYINAQVFTDCLNDGVQYAGGLVWATSITYSEEPKPQLRIMRHEQCDNVLGVTSKRWNEDQPCARGSGHRVIPFTA